MFFIKFADLAHLVERDLAKVEVAGSSPVIRSIFWRHSQAVRQRSAKPSSPVRFRVAPPTEKHPFGCFSVGGATLLSIALVAQSAANRFAFAARRSASSLARRRASESSPKVKFRDLILKTAILSPASNESFTRSSVCWLTERTFYGILSRKDRDIVTGRKS